MYGCMQRICSNVGLHSRLKSVALSRATRTEQTMKPHAPHCISCLKPTRMDKEDSFSERQKALSRGLSVQRGRKNFHGLSGARYVEIMLASLQRQPGACMAFAILAIYPSTPERRFAEHGKRLTNDNTLRLYLFTFFVKGMQSFGQIPIHYSLSVVEFALVHWRGLPSAALYLRLSSLLCVPSTAIPNLVTMNATDSLLVYNVIASCSFLALSENADCCCVLAVRIDTCCILLSGCLHHFHSSNHSASTLYTLNQIRYASIIYIHTSLRYSESTNRYRTALQFGL